MEYERGPFHDSAYESEARALLQAEFPEYQIKSEPFDFGFALGFAIEAATGDRVGKRIHQPSEGVYRVAEHFKEWLAEKPERVTAR